jgi:hypothetical protein
VTLALQVDVAQTDIPLALNAAHFRHQPFFALPLQPLSLRASLALLAALARSASAVGFAAAPNASNILVLSTTGGVATLSEWTTAAGQSAPVQSVSVTGCSVSMSAHIAYGSMSMDGESLPGNGRP